MNIDDRTLEILDNLHLLRMRADLTARRLGISVNEVNEARRNEDEHTREVFLAKADRRRRGVVRPIRPLTDEEFAETA